MNHIIKTTMFKRESTILNNILEKHPISVTALKNNAYVAGGAIRSLFTSSPINDYDLFFEKESDFNNTLKGLTDFKFLSTDTAMTHNDSKTKQIFQLICATYADPENMLDTFDFTICMAAWKQTGEFIFNDRFLQHCSQKRLCFNTNAKFPICSLWRALKYIKRGYKLPAIDLIKIALCINNVDLKNRKELKRQLMGIDTMFLKKLTDALDKDGELSYDFGEALEMLNNLFEDAMKDED